MQRHIVIPGDAVAYHLRRAARILWNVLTFSETAQHYPHRAHELLWKRLIARSPQGRLVLAYGRFLQRRNRARQIRRPMSEHTFFLRNAPHFELLGELVRDWPAGAPLRIASIGCSTGAELYSAIWTIRSVRPDIRLFPVGVDLSAPSLEIARHARYARTGRELERLTPDQIADLARRGLFEVEPDAFVVQRALTEGIAWVHADASAPSLFDQTGEQDILFINNLLCHLYDAQADACLRNVARLLAAGGYLFVYGVDLDVKTRVIRSLGWMPVLTRIEELYNGDAPALRRWPWTYWGPEPFDRTRSDWMIRYATVYRCSADSVSS